MNFSPVQLKDPSKITVEEIMNVVLVDDSLLVRERVANIISEIPGVKVIGEAGNSREAIAVVRKTNPDVVMLDIKMPGESGLQVLKKLRNEFEELKIVMLTNYSDSQYKAECLMHGADYFLSKSDEFEKLPELFSKLGKTQIGKLKKIN
jgi:DNA-binding NarL/FixJ family response regulator